MFQVLDPALRELVPIVQYLGLFKQDLVTSFANLSAATQATAPSQAGGDPVHYLRVIVPFTQEGLTFQSKRLASNRHNPYFTPEPLRELPQGLEAFDCANAGGRETEPAPLCKVQKPLEFQGKRLAIHMSTLITRSTALAALCAAVFASSASAAPRITSSQRPLISDNITPVFTVPGVHPIGARIRGNYMYVTGPEGLTTFDISDPEHPLPAGALPLPHFENEDVDLGGDTLLISNDPSEGVGILYVIDISKPSAPMLVSATPNGYVDFCQGCFGIGAEATVPPGVGHTASCVPGPKGACQYAYLAGTGQGIAIVDLTDRSKPFVAKTFKPDITGAATHDVQIDGAGLAWIVGYEGSEAYDVSDPLNPKPAMRTDPNIKNTGVIQPGVVPPSANPNDDKVIADPIFGITVGGKGDTPIDFIHHDSLRFGKPAKKGAATRTYPAGGKSDIVGIVEEDYARPTCEGAGSFQTWKIGDDSVLRLQDMWATEVQALPEGSGFAPVAGVCSAHYFDQRDGLVANAWYEEGTRFLDVSDPKNIKQVGYWIPAKGETWSAIFAPNDPTGQTVYALDLVRGIEVLHIDRSESTKTKAAPVRRSWVQKKSAATAASISLSGWSKQGRYGYICRIATAKAVRAAR